jgi:hypothetical protein
VEVVSLPAAGSLYVYKSGALTPLSAGDFLPHTEVGAYTGALLYQGTGDYFTSPAVTWNGTAIAHDPPYDAFAFRVHVLAGAGAGNLGTPASSPAAVQRIHVKNVNGPTFIEFTYPHAWEADQRYTIYALSNAGAGDPYVSQLQVRGFNLTDPDLDVDRIRVTITTQAGGRITLNTDILPWVDFNSVEYCFSAEVDWDCDGDGTSDSSMGFVAAPSVVAAALWGMTYSNDQPYTNDKVTVTLYDGEVGEVGLF